MPSISPSCSVAQASPCEIHALLSLISIRAHGAVGLPPTPHREEARVSPGFSHHQHVIAVLGSFFPSHNLVDSFSLFSLPVPANGGGH